MHTVVGKKVRKRPGKEKPFLPDEIIRNILIRLPFKSVVRSGLVCKRWRYITLARDFVDLHLKCTIPVILVSSSKIFSPLNLFALDKWWDLARRRSMIHRFPFRAEDFPYASIKLFSHAGLIVLGGSPLSDPKITILNPARPSDECVEINYSIDFWRSANICAVYYHPTRNEYCSLWKIHKPGQPLQIQYKLLNLGSDPSFKTISDAFPYRVKGKDAYPLFIDNHRYWKLKSGQEDKFGGRNDILEFDIISEEFKVIPCPIPLNTECKEYQTHLLNSDGVISLILILPSTISIWRLKDRVKHLWSTTEYTISIENSHDSDAAGIISVVDEKLAFELGRRLFVCNLMDGTVKKYPKRKYSGDLSFLSHRMSLASLKDFTISIWRLEDHVEQLWTTIEYTISLEICRGFEALGIVDVVDGKLAFEHRGKLLVCNFLEGTVKKDPKK